jgi:hypothetical protein
MNTATVIMAVCLSFIACACRPNAPASMAERQYEKVSAPDCAGVERWPTTMAFTHLANAGITDNDRLDLAKTKATLLASEPLEDGMFRQVHLVTFTEKAGNGIQVITVNDASRDECSMSGVDVYVISRHLGPN